MYQGGEIAEKESIFTLSEKFMELKEKKDELNKLLKETNAKILKAEKELVESMMDEDIAKFSRAGKLFFIKETIAPNLRSDKKAAVYEAIKHEGFGDIVVEHIHPQTLKSFVKEQYENNDSELPEWLAEAGLEVYTKASIGMRKSK